MSPWTEDEEAALGSGVVRFGIFFLLRTDPAVRLWAGVGDIDVGTNSVEVGTHMFRGAGVLQDVPAVQGMINGKAERITFRLSGVDKRVVQLAREENPAVQGKTVHLGIGLFRPDWSDLVGPVRWVWRGRADFTNETFDAPETPTDRFVRTVELSVGSLMTSRKRSQNSYYTNKDQQARSPGDEFCDRTPNYAQEYTKKFGPHG